MRTPAQLSPAKELAPMSVNAEMADHPSPHPAHEALGTAVKHALYCAGIATSCADACLAEPMDMAACIRKCLDCADICTALARIAARQTATDPVILRAALEACIAICEACQAECEKHDNPHCERCARMCMECARDCRIALEAIG
jgi:hypothetical protein